MPSAANARTRLVGMLLAIAISLSPGHVYSTSVVGATEITQMMNNVELAIQTSKQQMQYAQQLEQKYRELLQLAPAELIAFGRTVQEVRAAADSYRSLSSATANLYGSLDEMQELGSRRFRDFAASGMTWEQYLERNRERNEREHESAQIMTGAEAHALKRVQHYYEQMQKVADEIPNSDGVHSATMQLNAQMNMLTAQINDMFQLQAMQSRRQTDMEDDANTDRERQRQLLEKQMERYRVGADQDRAVLEYLKSR